MTCQVLEYSTAGENGVTQFVYSQSPSTTEDCGKSNASERVILDGYQYQELAVKAGQLATIDQAAAAIDPAEVSAVFGAAFALVMFLSAVAYKVRVGKNLIKLL